MSGRPSVRLQPVKVATGSNDSDGQLVFHDDFLVAVLVRLSDDHEDEAGKWFLEVGFGRLGSRTMLTFADLTEAQDWIARRLAEIGTARHAAIGLEGSDG